MLAPGPPSHRYREANISADNLRTCSCRGCRRHYKFVEMTRVLPLCPLDAREPRRLPHPLRSQITEACLPPRISLPLEPRWEQPPGLLRRQQPRHRGAAEPRWIRKGAKRSPVAASINSTEPPPLASSSRCQLTESSVVFFLAGGCRSRHQSDPEPMAATRATHDITLISSCRVVHSSSTSIA
jgi:hypothetical protein